MADKKCFQWSELGEEWIGATYIWSDVCIMIKVKDAFAGGGGGGIILTDKNAVDKIQKQLDPEEYKRFIAIVCRVNGLTYQEIKSRDDAGLPTVTFKEIKAAIQSVTHATVRIRGIRRGDI